MTLSRGWALLSGFKQKAPLSVHCIFLSKSKLSAKSSRHGSMSPCHLKTLRRCKSRGLEPRTAQGFSPLVLDVDVVFDLLLAEENNECVLWKKFIEPAVSSDMLRQAGKFSSLRLGFPVHKGPSTNALRILGFYIGNHFSVILLV